MQFKAFVSNTFCLQVDIEPDCTLKYEAINHAVVDDDCPLTGGSNWSTRDSVCAGQRDTQLYQSRVLLQLSVYIVPGGL